ncbi:hypothetical protein Anapl_16016 [Anas platyrhynchos]|uniref:Uncharacterized protein n=1 Tax=Anas platyrhynchos TaxID=8839 RepID=R0LU09_ANAPL|nr:hypothetical protein Anapl_16016 [Anas platyrhynchos]
MVQENYIKGTNSTGLRKQKENDANVAYITPSDLERHIEEVAKQTEEKQKKENKLQRETNPWGIHAFFLVFSSVEDSHTPESLENLVLIFSSLAKIALVQKMLFVFSASKKHSQQNSKIICQCSVLTEDSRNFATGTSMMRRSFIKSDKAVSHNGKGLTSQSSIQHQLRTLPAEPYSCKTHSQLKLLRTTWMVLDSTEWKRLLREHLRIVPLRTVREKEPSARQETPGIQEVHSQLHALQHSTESSKIRVAPLLSQTAVTASTFFSPRPMTYPAVLLRYCESPNVGVSPCGSTSPVVGDNIGLGLKEALKWDAVNKYLDSAVSEVAKQEPVVVQYTLNTLTQDCTQVKMPFLLLSVVTSGEEAQG